MLNVVGELVETRLEIFYFLVFDVQHVVVFLVHDLVELTSRLDLLLTIDQT